MWSGAATHKATTIVIIPDRCTYKRVLIDEHWSYMGKKDKKVSILYSYVVEEDEILAFTLGKRSAKTVANLLIKLRQLNIKFFMIDD